MVSPSIIIEVRSLSKIIKQCCVSHTGKEVHGRGLAVLTYEIKTYKRAFWSDIPYSQKIWRGIKIGMEVRWWGLLVHTSELKLWHFEVFPYVCIGKPHVCNVFRPHAT